MSDEPGHPEPGDDRSGDAQAAGTISVSFDETLEDTFAHAMFLHELPWWRREGEKRFLSQQKNTLMWIAIIGMFGFGIIGVVGREFVDHPERYGALAGVVAGCFLWGKYLLRSHWNERVRRHTMAQIKAQGFTWPRRASLSARPRGVVMTWGDYQISMAWKHMYGVWREGGRVHFVMGNGSGMSIPDAAFGGESEAAAFAERSVAFMAEAGETMRQRLTKYLKERDVACPKCGYALRGVTVERCPECGYVLEQIELMALEAKRTRKRGSFRLTR